MLHKYAAKLMQILFAIANECRSYWCSW